MAERLEDNPRDGQAAPAASPYRMRLAAANDNIAPVRHIVGKLLVAGAVFAATFAVAYWWL